MALPGIPLARLRAALEVAGAPPRKRHGQHFLQDNNLLAAIVRDAGVAPGDRVLEIGPGPGLLTRHLLAAGAGVVAIEIDPRVQAVARELIEPALAERLTWNEGDALAGHRELSPVIRDALPSCTHVVSNLPYNVGAQIVILLMTHADCPEHLVFLLQREVGERLLAAPGSRDYGPLAVFAALCTEARLLRRVPAAAFWPPPRVESVLVGLSRRPVRPEPVALQELEAFLAAAFHSRRKTLLNSLAGAARITAAEVARRLGGEEKLEKARAEALAPVQLQSLAHAWARAAQSGPNRS